MHIHAGAWRHAILSTTYAHICTCSKVKCTCHMSHARAHVHAHATCVHVHVHVHVHACACTCPHVCVHVWHVHMCGMCICAHVTIVSYVHAVAHMDMHTCVQLHLFYTFINSRIKIQTHPILHSDPDLWGGRSLRTYAPLSVGLVRPRTVTRWSESHSHGLGQLLTNVQVREEVASRCGALGVGVTYTLLSRKRSKPLPHPTGPLWLTNLTARVSDDGAAPARGACAAAPARRRRPRRTGRAST